MIRKFGTVDAPVDVVRGIFADIESWPQWMPSVQTTRILERSDSRVVAEIDRRIGRRARTATFEFRFKPDGHVEHQIRGSAKKWESQWRFQVGPRHVGTLVSCRLQLDMGIIGLLASSKRIQRWIDRTFEETLDGLQRQARLDADKTVAGKGARSEVPISRIQVFATATGLEIWIDGRKYVAHAAD